MNELRDLFAEVSTLVNAELDWLIASDGPGPRSLREAMRWSLFGGGKHFRPALLFAVGRALGAPDGKLVRTAAAVEMIHTYSLIHDDLPSMDDDDLRRGRPTCHKAYDEATAILVGDALQVLAFETLATGPGLPAGADVRLRLVNLLAVASGTNGMAGGQALDLDAMGRQLSIGEVAEMHARKTGALIRASVMMAAACAPEVSATALGALEKYATDIGLAFQIQDDLLDIEGDPGVIGKATGADSAHNKPTYPSVAGIDAARKRMSELHASALHAIRIPELHPEPLQAVSNWLVLRRS